MKTDGVWVIVWAQLDIQAREAGWDPRAGAGGEVGRESRTAEVSSARGQGLEGAWRVGRSEHEAGQRAGPRKVHELPRDAADPRLPLVKDAEDTVEVRRFDQAVPAVRVQCAAPPARVAVRVLIRLMMAHLDPKVLQHIVEPEIELRLDALAERIAQGELRHLRHTAVQPLNLCHRAHGPSPFRHGIVSSTRPLPIRTNITRQGKPLKAVRHNMRPNPPPAGQANNEGAHGTGAALQPSRQACHLAKS